jgi:lipopolysaccharide export system protein LptA
MRQKSFAYSLLMLLMLFSGTGAFAQKKEKKDSLVRLLGCNELRQMEVLGVSYRKACGNASFEHNSTKLLCDTALWNVNTNIIKAIGHVRIIQNRTVLTSDKLDYFIDDNLAQFRGSVVQLQDKDKNTLRTKDLDYNTKDSVAIFRNGGALRDKDGQIIESNFGSYDSKTATFSFIGNVNMYTDSVFVKTDNLEFNTQTNIAVFGSGTNAWRGSSMLSASAGWYNRSDEVFLFYRKVHVMTENQEAWSDSLKYYKVPNNAELFGHCELLDTTRHAAALAGYMYYNDSTSLIRMTRDPAIIMESKEGDKVDTVYVGADRLVYWTVPRCNVAESEI